MTNFINKHLQKVIYTSIGALLMSAFTLGTIWKEHGNLMSDVQTLKLHDDYSREKQSQLMMNDSLWAIKLNSVIQSQQDLRKEQNRSNKVLFRIANKLHVEIPAE